MKIKINYFAAMLLAMFAGGGIGAQGAEQPKKATSHTIEYNQKFLGAHGLARHIAKKNKPGGLFGEILAVFIWNDKKLLKADS